MMDMRSVRPEEELARSKFDACLQASGEGARAWCPGPPSKAPDFWLRLGSDKYAVEVTAVWRSFDAPRPMSRRGVSAGLRDYAKRLEQEAICNGWLQGTYTITFRPPASLNEARDHARHPTLEYIRNTRGEERFPPLVVYQEPAGLRWSIEKIHSRQSRLLPIMAPPLGKASLAWSSDAEVALRDLVRCQRYYEDQSLQCTMLLSRASVASIRMSDWWGNGREHAASI